MAVDAGDQPRKVKVTIISPEDEAFAELIKYELNCSLLDGTFESIDDFSIPESSCVFGSRFFLTS